MKKSTISLIFIVHMIVVFLVNLYYKNYFLTFIILSVLVLDLILCLGIYYLYFKLKKRYLEEKKAINELQIDTKIKKDKHTALNQSFKMKTNTLYLLVMLFVLLPLSAVYYQEHHVVRLEDANDIRKINHNLDGTYILSNDIDLKSVRTYQENKCDEGSSFNGEFDGNGYTLSNLNHPLFYCVGKKGRINNLKLNAVDINANEDMIGAIAKINYGKLDNIQVDGKVKGINQVGGIVGKNSGLIKGVSFTGEVIGTDFVGGLIGKNFDFIEVSESYVSGVVTGDTFIGGISGESNTMSDGVLVHDNLINMKVRGKDSVGGIAGIVIGNIESNIILGDIDGQTEDVGMIAGVTDISHKNLFVGSIQGYDQPFSENVYVLKDNTDYILNQSIK